MNELIKNIHILVVDDNKENLRVVSNFLKTKGYNITLALDGNEAINIARDEKIDLILLDVMMPMFDGYDTCKILKEEKELKDIPVIFLTAKTETEDIVKGFNAGAVDYITKPFNKEELFARVNCHIELKLIRDYLKTQLLNHKDSGNSMMKMLLDFGKKINPNG